MQHVRDRYCSFCGAEYPEPLRYPRKCPSPACGVEVWANPVPVVVLLLPVLRGTETGLLVLRRGIEPRRGHLALPGGFLEEHESWQCGATRELREELGVTVDPTVVETFGYASSSPRPNRVLLFSTAPAVSAEGFPPFVPNHETLERGVVWGPEGLDEVFAFGLHVDAVRRWFAREGITGAHRYGEV